MLVGLQKQKNLLEKSFSQNRLAHAYLFYGPEKVGKKTLAFNWLSSVFHQDLFKTSHPDFVFLEPEQGKKEIHISQVKDLIARLRLKPYSAPFKAAVIDQAQSMNQEAQTALLKTLEEPQGQTLIILVAEIAEALLPTIASRTQKVRFYPVSGRETAKFLEEKMVSARKSKMLAELSFGRPGLLVDLLSDSQKADRVQRAAKEAAAIIKSDLVSRFQQAKKVSDQENPLETLSFWLYSFRQELLSSLSQGKSSEKLVYFLKRLEETRSLLSYTNVNPRLALEVLMLEI